MTVKNFWPDEEAEVVVLKNVVTLKSGGTPSKSKDCYWGGDYPWITAKDLKTPLLQDSIDRLTAEGFSRAKTAPNNAILMLVRGMTLFKDVPVCLTGCNMAFNQDIKALLPSEDVDPKFLLFCLRSRKKTLLGLVDSAGHGTGRLNTDLLKNLQIVLPGLLEQRAIADLLSTWDKAIEKTERLIQAKERRFRWLLRELISEPRNTRKGTEWKKVKLGELCEIQIGRTPSRKNVEYWDAEQISGNYWLSITDLSSSRKITSSKEQVSNIAVEQCNMKLIPEGTIVMSFKLTLGRTCLLNISAFTNEAIAAFLNLSSKVYKDYLFHYLPTVNWDSLVDQAAKGKTLNKEKLNGFAFELPPIEEQQQIAETLNMAQQEIDLLKRLTEKYKTQKRGLMQKMLTGEWRVKPETVNRYKEI